MRMIAKPAAHRVHRRGMMVDYELDELKREFLDEARMKVSEMESVLAEGKSRSSLDRLAYLAHQLKGSGGSYGYQRISQDAAEMERTVEHLAESGDGTGTSSGAEIEQCLANLRAAVEKAIGNTS